METRKVRYLNFEGTHREIGKQIAEKTGTLPAIGAPAFFSDEEAGRALRLYDTYCPGLKEELEGYSEESGIRVMDMAFSWMTYLIPGCSGLALPASRMADGRSRLARNYEFNPDLEDLTVVRTKARGKYAHIAGSTATFGRTEGINECGLAVSMSSCGLPVGNMEGMRRPEIRGLQFWAVIRSLLENSRNTEEALQMALIMPIAYNINLYLIDETGDAVLLETMNGQKSYERIARASERNFFCGTNHIVITSFQYMEPVAMRNSVTRLEKLHQFALEHSPCSEGEIRDFLLKEYPAGPTVRYYNEFFGTIKSVVMDPAERRYSICWFGEEKNGWEDFCVSRPLQEKVLEKTLNRGEAGKEFFEIIPLDTPSPV